MYVEVGYKGGAKGAACSQPGVHRSLVFLLLQFPLKALEHSETWTMQAPRDWVCSNGVKCLFLSCFFASKTAVSISSCSISTGCCWKFLLCLIIQSCLYCSHSSFKFCVACSHCPVSTFDGAIKLDDVLSKRVKGVVDIHQQETVTTTSALCMDVHCAFRHLDLLQSQSLETNCRVKCLCLWESCRVFSDFGNFDRFSQGNVTLIANRATSGTSPTSSFWHKEKLPFCLFLKQQKRSWTQRIMIPIFLNLIFQ